MAGRGCQERAEAVATAAARSARSDALCQARPRQRGRDLHTASLMARDRMAKSRRTAATASTRPSRMTTAEATVAALIAHGIDTIYALPGVHNDHLFDALFKAARPHPHRPHPPRAGRRLHGARRGARDRQAAGLRGGAGAGPAQFRGRAAHRLRHERAGAGADRPDRRRPPSAAGSAICTRSATRPASSRRLVDYSARIRDAARGAAPGRRGDARDGDRPARPGGAGMRDRRLGPQRRRSTPITAPLAAPRSRRSTTTRSETPPSVSAPPSAR